MAEPPHLSPRLKRNLLLLLIPALLSATVVLLLFRAHPETSYWINLFVDGRLFLESNPWALILALAILPGLGFPVSPLLILFGIVLTPEYGAVGALAIALVSQAICTIWTYAVSAGPFRNILTKFILSKRELPQFTESNALRFALIIRLTPGLPYAIQNIVLGISGIPFRTYLLVSIPATSVWSVGFVLTGGALFEGNSGLILVGILLLVVCILATRLLRNRKRLNA